MSDLSLRSLVKENPVTATLGLWGTVLVGTGIYLWRKPIPMQLKIIQARVIAQGALLTGVMAVGLITFIQDPDGSKHKAATAIDVHHMKMYDLPPKPVPAAALDTPVSPVTELK